MLRLFPTKKAASGPPPTDPIGKSGAQLWYRADSVVLTGSNVLGWVDKSGNGRNATNAGTGFCTWNASGVNGKPTVTFPGGLTPPYFTMGGATAILPIGSAGAVIIVTKSAGVPAAGFGLGLSLISDGSGNWCSFLTSNTAGYGLYTIGGGGSTAKNINCGFDPGAVWSGIVNNYNGGGAFDSNANWVVVANNTTQTMSNGTGTVGTGLATSSYLGIYTPSTMLPYTGDIAEILVYNSQLTGPQLVSMHNYLNARYGAGVG